MERELTILCYFATDNPLAPLVISEIKAIKDAGFQANTSVLVYFDPMVKGAPTQLFDVNRKRREEKANGTFIGDGEDPFVRNMAEDELDPKVLLPPGTTTAKKDPDTVEAAESLSRFIDFATRECKARNYILFLLGHGMIVANDAFLPDDNPVSSITLKQLRGLSEKFNQGDSRLRLLALHSCSMSSVELAYELRGKADYLLASQGTVFINAYPYRQMLKKTLNQVKKAKQPRRQGEVAAVDYKELANKLYFLCLHNFTDFLNAGYSCDLALCSLDRTSLEKLKTPLMGLVKALKEELTPDVSLIKDLVLLAHWDSQSFWSENYTDLWDFCDRLAARCDSARAGLENTAANELLSTRLRNISGFCGTIKNFLVPQDKAAELDGVVRHADNGGTEFQFARGLSIYFPWSKPLDDQRGTIKAAQDNSQVRQTEAKGDTIMALYRDYDFSQDFGEHSWFSFLERYFADTKRKVRDDPRGDDPPNNSFKQIADDVGSDEASVRDAFAAAETAFFNGVTLKKTPQLKKTPTTGDDCTCPSIKNFPTAEDKDKKELPFRRFWITPGALEAFLPETKNKKPVD